MTEQLPLPAMKIVAFLLAVLILALSVLPCTDKNSLGKSAKASIVKATHPQDNADDDCSPFCQCSCCANFSIHNQPSTSLAVPFPFQGAKAAGYLSSHLYSVSLPVWQPPQLI